MANLTISTRMAGRREPLEPDWSIPWPPGGDGSEGESLTLRDLITRIVLEETAAFRRRQRQRRLVHVLTAREIDANLGRGRVDPVGHNLKQNVDDDQAVATALQAFEDGLYLVVLDGEEQHDLDRQVFLRPDSHLVFLRLVMLAGG
jgi:hypothetical protein